MKKQVNFKIKYSAYYGAWVSSTNITNLSMPVICADWLYEHFDDVDERKTYKLTVVRNGKGLITFENAVCGHIHTSHELIWKYRGGGHEYSLYTYFGERCRMLFDDKEKRVSVDLYLEEL